jgi:hypothetical protein
MLSVFYRLPLCIRTCLAALTKRSNGRRQQTDERKNFRKSVAIQSARKIEFKRDFFAICSAPSAHQGAKKKKKEIYQYK